MTEAHTNPQPAAATRTPQSLAEVKAGDVVVISCGGYWHPHCVQRTVDRLTATQIVIGAEKYRRSDGCKVGGNYRLVFGDDAKQLIAKVSRKRAESDFLHALDRPDFTPDSIRAIRAACDAAEAALREAGEWTDE